MMIDRIMRQLAWLVLVGLSSSWVGAASPGSAKPATALDQYLDGLTTWSADFRQSIVDSRGKKLGEGRGRLIVVRPGKFRWESSPVGELEAVQVLVADGRNLWFLDQDLEQATVKPLDSALPQSPAMLLAGGASVREAFVLRAVGLRDGFDWVIVTPRDTHSDFKEAQFGFRARQLTRMVIIDKLGQRSVLNFSTVERNRPVDPSLVAFVLPKGVNLIGKPLTP
jgi:outer membrane lipoprotein carrier protein